ncbi:MAG: hypothetical protein H6556_13835 [Lewinellaceae bacterium]|nr:hypothetical protein [Lewinellaceae bacterium]
MTAVANLSELNKLQNILKYTYGLVPIAAGADKFLNLLTEWEAYLSPTLADILPFSASAFMMTVGVIEIAAGVIVLARAEIGAYIVSAWLLVIALSLVFSGHHFDVAVRDIVMAIGAFVLARLTHAIQTK